MKIKNLMFLGLIFIILLSSSFIVLAQRADTKAAAEAATVDIADSINKALDWLFNVSFVDWDIMLITISVFLVLFIVFSDALIQFSPLSRNAALGVAFFLTLITALLRMPFTIAIYLMGITATVGVLSVFVSLVMVFAMYAVLHIILFKKLIPIFKGKGTDELKTFISDVKTIKRTMKEK